MRPLCRLVLTAVLLTVGLPAIADDVSATAKPESGATAVLSEDYSCLFCHGREGTLAEDDESRHLIVDKADLVGDVHWQKGLVCHECHGGNPVLEEFVAHRKDPDFQSLTSPADIPGFCGRCHSDTEYMRHYQPSPRTDQELEYWTSGHGKRLREAAKKYEQILENLPAGEVPPDMEEPQVATCVSCHSTGAKHHILAVDDQKSPVYPTAVAETCSKCHSDAQRMAGRTYHGRPLGHDQYELWKNSVHGQALLKKGDLSAPTCNDCHGNHGALPPDVDSVANACGKCHSKVAKLFGETRMRHQFEEAGLPGCATCHGNHQTLSPSDEMLGMDSDGVCARCHQDNQYGATLAGADAARDMRMQLEKLKGKIGEAEEKIAKAERLGMEVRGPRYDLRQALDALTNARSQVHTFSPEPVAAAVGEGLQVAAEVTASAEAALAEHTHRRIWLAASLAPILIVIILLLLYMRSLPVPQDT